MKKLLVLALVFIVALCVFALADKPDKAEGTPKLGDRVVFFTDVNNDGFFEKNIALVADDTNATARITPEAPPFGQPINLWVFPSEEAVLAGGASQPYFVRRATRGRFVGEYEALVTSNH